LFISKKAFNTVKELKYICDYLDYSVFFFLTEKRLYLFTRLYL